jgi:hypothetical protein
MAPLALQPHLPQAHRAALYMRYVLQYASWWDVEGGNRYPVRPEDHREDQGFGVPMFLSLKKIIAALMILGQQVGDGEIDQRRIDDLMWNA